MRRFISSLGILVVIFFGLVQDSGAALISEFCYNGFPPPGESGPIPTAQCWLSSELGGEGIYASHRGKVSITLPSCVPPNCIKVEVNGFHPVVGILPAGPNLDYHHLEYVCNHDGPSLNVTVTGIAISYWYTGTRGRGYLAPYEVKSDLTLGTFANTPPCPP